MRRFARVILAVGCLAPAPRALADATPAAERLARSESLQAHGLSVRARLDRLNGKEGQ